jgi:DNA mismatch repair protein MutL
MLREKQAPFNYTGFREKTWMPGARGADVPHAVPSRVYTVFKEELPPGDTSEETKPEDGEQETENPIYPQGAPIEPICEQRADAGELTYSNLPVIGQLGNSFILLEAQDGLVIIDQHAAHERILFNSLNARTKHAGQLLTRPAIVDLLPKEALTLKKLTCSLSEFGFEIEPFGGSSFAIHAVPASLSGHKPEEILRDFLRFAEDECPTTQSEILSGLAKVASCHGAVRAGQKLRREEITHLLQSLDETRTPFTCPHGRPLSFKITYDQIFRFFKRT